MTILPVYAALLGLLFIVLSMNVIRTRAATETSLGTGDDELLERRIRAHGNFAEYVPISLILIGLAELTGASTAIVHFMGGALLIGRLMHGYALSSLTKRVLHRRGGMILTFAVIIAAALRLLWAAISSI
jgi:hypothetical protein